MDYVVMKSAQGKISCIPLDEYKVDPKKYDWEIAASQLNCSDVAEAVYKFALDISPKEEILKTVKAYLEHIDWEIDPLLEVVSPEDIERINVFLDGELLGELRTVYGEDGCVWWD